MSMRRSRTMRRSWGTIRQSQECRSRIDVVDAEPDGQAVDGEVGIALVAQVAGGDREAFRGGPRGAVQDGLVRPAASAVQLEGPGWDDEPHRARTNSCRVTLNTPWSVMRSSGITGSAR